MAVLVGGVGALRLQATGGISAADWMLVAFVSLASGFILGGLWVNWSVSDSELLQEATWRAHPGPVFTYFPYRLCWAEVKKVTFARPPEVLPVRWGGNVALLLFGGIKGQVVGCFRVHLNLLRPPLLPAAVIAEFLSRVDPGVVHPDVFVMHDMLAQSAELGRSSSTRPAGAAFRLVTRCHLRLGTRMLRRLHRRGGLGLHETTVLAQALYLTGQHRAALPLCDDVLRAEPANGRALVLKSLCLWRRLRPSEARDALQAVLPGAGTDAAFLAALERTL